MWKTGNIIRWVLGILVVIDMSFFLKSYLQRPKGIDPFYTNKGEWDDVEVPLTKPYQLIKLNGNPEWGMNLEEGASMLGDVKKLNVVNGYIFIYSRKTYFFNDLKPVWAVIDVHNRLEMTFDSYTDYVNCINETGISEPVLYNVEDVAKYSGQHDVMDWKEANKIFKP